MVNYMEISVTQFKAKCLRLIEQVEHGGETVVITRHGRVAAQLLPVKEGGCRVLFGRAKSKTRIKGDLFTTGESWRAED
jgi:prevent-host-death family protein